jgi:hypothetical protein
MWSASRVELPEYVAEVQHGACGIFDWASGNEEESREEREAGQPPAKLRMQRRHSCNRRTVQGRHIATCTLHSRHLSRSLHRRLDTTKSMSFSGADFIVAMQRSLAVANVGAATVAVPRPRLSWNRCCW